MTRFLLATSSAVALATFAAHPARALVCANCAEEVTQVTSWAKQVADMANQARLMVQANTSLTGIMGSVSGASGVDLSGLNSVRSVLSDVGQVRTALSGIVGSVNGLATPGNLSLSGAANAILNANTVYRPQGSDFMAQWLNARAQGQAAEQDYMNQFLQSAQQRQQALLDLKQRQMQATTTDERMAIQNEIGITEQELDTQAQQAQSIAALAATQEKVREQQIMEKQRADAEGLARLTQPAADAVGLKSDWAGSGGSSLVSAAQPTPSATSAASVIPANVPTFNVSGN